MPVEQKTIETDVLVVGSEGAGSRAAIEVSRNGLRVLIATKGRFTKCGATLTADMTMDLPSRDAREIFGLDGDPADTPESFAQNMFEEGKYMNNEEVILAHCSNAGKHIKELADWGIRIDGLAHRPGHRYPRGLLSTGRSMMEALKKGTKGCKIDWLEDSMITDLLTAKGRVVGAVGFSMRSGEFLVIKAKAVILATGGAMRLYPVTTAPEELTGDGIYMAYQAGAELVDMEFPMFLPCCVYWPESMSGVDMPYVYSVTVGGWWLNKFGVRFIEKWDQRMEQGTTRDIASIAMAMEIFKGRGTPHGGVWASFDHLPDGLLETAIQDHEFWKNFTYGGFDLIEFNMDPRKVGYEVGPASHYWNGGIRINAKCETIVPGVYAAGEVQGATMGANPLAGNAVTECLVFGALSGASAAAYAKKAPPPEIDKEQVASYYERVHAPLNRKDGADAYELRNKMQQLAFKKIGPIKDADGITACIEEAGKLKKDMLPNQATKHKGKIFNREWVVAIENEALLQIMEIIARTSLMRKESRGALYRLDCPDTDNKEWLKNIIVANKGGKVSLETSPVVATRMKLPPATRIPYMVPEWKFDKRSSERTAL